MNQMNRVIMALLLTVLASKLTAMQVQEVALEGTKDECITIDARAMFENTDRGIGIFFSRVEIGELTPDQLYLVRLQVVNRTAVSMPMRSARVNCNCSSIHAVAGDLGPGQERMMEVRFRAPDGGIPEFAILVDFYDDPLGRPTGQITLNGVVCGLLGLRTQPGVLQVPKKGGEWDFPILVSRPVQVERLVLSKAKSLEAVELAVERDSKDSPVLRIRVLSQSVPESGVHGEFTIKDPAAERTFTSWVRIVRERDVMVSPDVLRFSRADESLEGGVVATAIMKLSRSSSKTAADDLDERGEKEDVSNTPIVQSINLLYRDREMVVKSVPIGDGSVFRLTVWADEVLLKLIQEDLLDRSDSKEASPVLFWKVRTSIGVFDFPVSLFISIEEP